MTCSLHALRIVEVERHEQHVPLHVVLYRWRQVINWHHSLVQALDELVVDLISHDQPERRLVALALPLFRADDQKSPFR